MRKLAKASLVSAALLVSTSGNAAVLYSNPVLQTATASPGSVAFTATAPSAGPAALRFNLNGFASLDGVNAFEDDFTLSLNGTTILSLAYDLGGGGSNAIFTNAYAAAVSYSTPVVSFGGGQLLINIASLPLLAGNNIFSFAYTSPTGAALGGSGAHAGPQGIGDEAWGISNVTLITPNAAVPEAATWAMLMTGFGAAGFGLRRRQKRASISRLV